MRLGAGGPKEQRHLTLKLASGRAIEVTALYLGAGGGGWTAKRVEAKVLAND
jgi:hypothetical protein